MFSAWALLSPIGIGIEIRISINQRSFLDTGSSSAQSTQHSGHPIQFDFPLSALSFIQRLPDHQNILDRRIFENGATRDLEIPPPSSRCLPRCSAGSTDWSEATDPAQIDGLQSGFQPSYRPMPRSLSRGGRNQVSHVQNPWWSISIPIPIPIPIPISISISIGWPR